MQPTQVRKETCSPLKKKTKNEKTTRKHPALCTTLPLLNSHLLYDRHQSNLLKAAPYLRARIKAHGLQANSSVFSFPSSFFSCYFPPSVYLSYQPPGKKNDSDLHLDVCYLACLERHSYKLLTRHIWNI